MFLLVQVSSPLSLPPGDRIAPLEAVVDSKSLSLLPLRYLLAATFFAGTRQVKVGSRDAKAHALAQLALDLSNQGSVELDYLSALLTGEVVVWLFPDGFVVAVASVSYTHLRAHET